jgi:hypothetical protein
MAKVKALKTTLDDYELSGKLKSLLQLLTDCGIAQDDDQDNGTLTNMMTNNLPMDLLRDVFLFLIYCH